MRDFDRRQLFIPDEHINFRQDLKIHFDGSFDKFTVESLVNELRSLEFVELSRTVQGGPAGPIDGIPLDILEKMWHIAVTFGPSIAVLTVKKAYEILIAEKVKAWLSRNEKDRKPGTSETVTIYGPNNEVVLTVTKDKIEDPESRKNKS